MDKAPNNAKQFGRKLIINVNYNNPMNETLHFNVIYMSVWLLLWGDQYPEVWVTMESPKGLAMEGSSVIKIK